MLNALLFLFGLILYTFVEYAVHRWVLHGPMIKQHWDHHRNPDKNIRVPLLVMAPTLLLVWLAAGSAFAVGMLVCWVLSGVLHRRLHTVTPISEWELNLRAHHMGHHRQATTNYGVSTLLWDRLFGTFGNSTQTP